MGSSIRIVELKRSLKMYDQLRLEKYGLCCKMKVTTVVSILGWVGLVSSILESLILLILPIVLWSLLRAYVWAIVMFFICSPIFLFSLITRSILLKRNKARNFSGVKKIMKIICQSYLSLRLIGGLIIAVIFLIILILWSMALLTNFEATSFIDKSEDSAETELPKSIHIIMVVNCIFLSSDLIFTCIGIHGVRKNRKNIINAFIIFNIVELMLFILYSVILYSVFTSLDDIIPVVTATVVLLLLSYQIGHFVVVYNMIDVSEEYGHEMRRV